MDTPADPLPCPCGKAGVVRLRDERGVRGACARCAVQICEAAGLERSRRFQGAASCNDVGGERRDVTGLMGELAFGRFARLPVDVRRLRGGDGGIDFATTIGTVDVKTWGAPSPPEMHRQTALPDGRRKPETAAIVVLARLEGKRASLVGWERGWRLDERPVKASPIGEVHWIAAADLRTMDELRLLLFPPPPLAWEAVMAVGREAFDVRYDDRGCAIVAED